MSDRTYDVRGFVLAYLEHRTYGALDNELGHYHRARYAALKAAAGVDVEAAVDAEVWVFAKIFERAAQRYLATASPLEGMMECPARVYQAVAAHERRLRELRDGTRDELVALLCTTFAAVWPAYRPVAESALAVHGFEGGPEPDPIDFW